MANVKIIIQKTETRSVILGENITAYVDKTHVDSYLKLIKKTWPQTEVKVNN